MHTRPFLLHALLAASGALATSGDGVSHPHKRAAALRSKNPKRTRAVPNKRDSSENPSYLTSKTEREYLGPLLPVPQRMCSIDRFGRVRRQWNGRAGGVV